MFDKVTKTYSDMLTSAQESFSQMPKTQAEFTEAMTKLKSVFEAESKTMQDMWSVYAKAATGDATPNQIAAANKQAQDMLTTARFAGIVAMPGAIFMLPTLVKLAKDAGVDLVPASVAKEFSI